mgnify:CR=1 FL=1
MNRDIAFLIKKLVQISKNKILDSDDFTQEERRVVQAINDSIAYTGSFIDHLAWKVKEREQHGKT